MVGTCRFTAMVARGLCIAASLLVCADGNPDAKRLYDDLIMKGYNRNVRPTTSNNDSTIITFGVRLAQIVRVVSSKTIQ